MMRYVILDADNRISLTADMDFPPELPHTEYDFSDDFDFTVQQDYRLIEDELIYAPLPLPAPPPTPQEDTDALLADHEERLIYMELGV